MNKVDAHIKKMMLSYPMLFPCRLDALRHLFMVNGNGYEWDEGGCVVSCFQATDDDEMRFDDLLHRKAELTKQSKEGYYDGCLKPLYEARSLELNREFLIRHQIADHIDTFASMHVLGEDHRRRADWLNGFNPEWCLLAVKAPFPGSAQYAAPYDRMDKEWAEAAEETMLIVSSCLRRALWMFQDNFRRELADQKLLKLYDQVQEILAKLDPITGRTERERRTAQILRERLNGEEDNG